MQVIFYSPYLSHITRSASICIFGVIIIGTAQAIFLEYKDEKLLFRHFFENMIDHAFI